MLARDLKVSPGMSDGFACCVRFGRAVCWSVGILAVMLGAGRAHAADDVAVYSDALAPGWENWSWDTTLNFANTTPRHEGTASLAVTHDAGWSGSYLHSTTTLSGAGYASLRFWIHGGNAGGQSIRVVIYDGDNQQVGEGVPITAPANSWQQMTLSLSSIGNPATIGGIIWQENSGAPVPTYYLDGIVLVGSAATPTPSPTPGSGPALSVDTARNRRRISPDIYGMNFADESLAAELQMPVRRWGGNSTTRYNYLHDTSNRAMDWYFENIPNDNDHPENLPHGSETDRFVEQDRRTGTKTILTMPMIGWTPKSREYAGGFSVGKYGPQQRVDPWRPDFGNGVRPNGELVTGNDPADTSVPATPAFVQQWIAHLIAEYGRADAGGVAFYNLDNEPMLWNSTHRDVHRLPTSYDELLGHTLAYAAAIKAADPTAATLGPVLWGWTAYFYSALDTAPGGDWWNNPLDRNAHGGLPFVVWYLQQLRAYEQQHGTRLLDYLDLHYYPQALGVSLLGAGNAETQALRLRSTRSLWDSTYHDESWIDDTVRLIPRMREWVQDNYPGTRLALTEYNWGALDHINGALAQADVLGIFGRQGLDLATLWSPPSSTDPGAFAFRMYRNYDGAGGQFGDTSVAAASADQERVAIYAATRTADGALTIMLINKTADDLDCTVGLGNFTAAGTAAVYRYSASSPSSIVPQPPLPVASSGFSLRLPAASIQLVVLPSAAPPVGGMLWILH